MGFRITLFVLEARSYSYRSLQLSVEDGPYIQGQSNEYSGGQVGDSISSPPGADLQKKQKKLSVEDEAIETQARAYGPGAGSTWWPG